MGPTLEFYALVSAELQRTDLGLWNGSDSYRHNSSNIADVVKSSNPVVHIEDTVESNGETVVMSTVVATAANTQTTNVHLTRSNSRSNALRNQQQQLLAEHSSSSSNDNALNMIIAQQFSDMATTEGGANNSPQVLEEQTITTTTATGTVTATTTTIQTASTVSYVHAAHGLFPLPLGKSSKLPQMTKAKSKFKFLGKFMAKAVMDSRMVSVASNYIILCLYIISHYLPLASFSSICRSHCPSIAG